EEVALVEANAAAQHAEVPQHTGQCVGGTGRRGPRPLADLATDLARVFRVLEEELAVAGQVIDGDLVRGDAGRVDEGDDQRGAAAGEDRIELEAAGQRVRDRAQAAHVVDVFGGGADDGVEALGLEDGGQTLPAMCVHDVT